MTNITSFRDVISLWPTRAAFAEEIDAAAPNVRLWYYRDVIPARYFHATVAAARRCGFKVSYAMLAGLEPGRMLGGVES